MKQIWENNRRWILVATSLVIFLCIILASNQVAVKQAEDSSIAQIAELEKQLAVEKEKNTTSADKTLASAEESAKVERVIDGDTIKLESGQVVRLIGIDAPESVAPEKPVQCFGPEASEESKRLLEGKEIRMEKDVSEKDQYGRLLRYVWVGDIFVNDYLVRNGFARADNFPPDEKFKAEFSQAQAEAKNNKRGLWGKCR
ncbi:MAG: thermonuclease family protein [Parcubacteria group bacterium]